MKTRLVGAESFHAEGGTERHDETNTRFSQSCQHASLTHDSQANGDIIRTSVKNPALPEF